MDTHQQDLVAQFCAVTGADPSAAQTALSSANWNLQEAVSLYYTAHDDDAQSIDEDEADEAEVTALPPASTSNPTPAPPAAASSSSSSRKPPTQQRPKQMTLDDLKKMQEHEGSDDDEHDKPQDMFAGGEKSGLAVQNPGQSGGGGGPADHFRNIMNQARQNRERPTAAAGEQAQQPQPQRSGNFGGRAQTLGGDDAPSQIVQDPSSASASGGRSQQQQQQQPAATRVTRTLHLWADGVSIDDGPLFRFDDPANASIMAEINRGRAPLALLDVQPDQEVDLSLEPHKGENYVQPKKKWKPFSGSGQRLGSPTPGPGPAPVPATSSASTSASQEVAERQMGGGAGTAGQRQEGVQVDESQPMVQLQIRLGDGTRLQSRFNTTHTVADVYSFVDRASPASLQRPYALMTTFPSKELDDRAVELGGMEDFKRGGVVVQKWK